jgi:uncharacterized RDD family membrane protein YckC
MTCPTCGGELVAGGDHCPVCDAGAVPRVEGALAADPRLVTPPARSRNRVEPLRDIPGLRKRERTWRDEVQERVRSRRQKRADAGLPLFDPPETADVPSVAPEAEAPEPTLPEAAPPVPAPAAVARATPSRSAPDPGSEHEPDLISTRLSEAELADLPLLQERDMEVLDREVAAAARGHAPSLDDEVLLGESGLEGEVELAPPAAEPTPVERPARPVERARAAAVDALLFAALAALVLYFTGRAARVEVTALISAWPSLAAYLVLLALFYAGYFTGTTGQTPGKLATGLRVVDASGRPPGYLRAVARALVGLLGTTLAGLGLVPMAFDPAARALHDRLFRTRVVRN